MPKRKGSARQQIRIAFDTSVLYTGSASDLMRDEIAQFVSQAQSNITDLDLRWYIPEVVLHERQYQMMARAREMLPAIERLETLLGHNLNITRDILDDRVRDAVERHVRTLHLNSLEVDPSRVDWGRLMQDATYRRPPFEPGDHEKGFRDAIICETFVQLVEQSPKTPQVCRVILVTNDRLLLRVPPSSVHR